MKFQIRIFSLLLIFSFILYSGCNEDPVSPINPSGTSIGTIESNPNVLEVNNSVDVTFRFIKSAGIDLIDSLLPLFKVDASGNLTTQIGILKDNGNLSNGDEISGDGVFSGIINLTETSHGESRFAVQANYNNQGTSTLGVSQFYTIQVFSALNNSLITEITTTLSQAENTFINALGGNVSNYKTAMTQTISFLQSQPNISNVSGSDASTSIEAKFTSGLYGCISFSLANANGTVITRGGFPSDSAFQRRPKGPRISPENQTRGVNTFGAQHNAFENIDNPNLDPDIIGNRNVLIFAPYEAAFAPYNEREKIKSNLSDGQCQGFEFTELVNQDATVKSCLEMTKYGMIVFATHGSQGRWIYSAEIVDTNSSDYNDIYKPLITAGRLAIAENVVISNSGGVQQKATVYAMHSSFFANLPGSFPNSVILNNSCESTMNADLSNAFTGKGAKTYYGYDKVVNSDFCVTIADTVSKRFARGLTTGEVYYNATDPSSPFAQFQISGDNQMKFSLSLMNGNFEVGTLEGWSKSGDGRVISQLGFVNPAQNSYMGIISTGLGFTVSSGSISQCFRVLNDQSTISLKWNFLSEEFLEYIGSQFQDYFEIRLITEGGQSIVLFRKTIDQIAADFQATEKNPGNLIYVSPGISFDQGDVYMTNWQNFSADISAYRGQVITVVFSAGDVGDSIFDTAILLDEITVQ